MVFFQARVQANLIQTRQSQAADAESDNLRRCLSLMMRLMHKMPEQIMTRVSRVLEWTERYQIIKEISRGLHYLHVERRIVHLDLKPTNILLDDKMIPKIADFGLSRRFIEKQTQIFTTEVMGTSGYMAPEFLTNGQITLKSDIYSLGVIITKILTGQKGYRDVEHVLHDVEKCKEA
ncbi:hypothetical protein ZWY2020_021640 [Hordeum vulgare]|nr:hypothetical protein ZWY2020_021640 [Hordeum vulgare]